MINYRKVLMGLALVFIFGLSFINNAMAVEIDMSLDTEFKYSYIADDTLPDSVIIHLENYAQSILDLKFSGIFPTRFGFSQYDLRLKGETENSSIDIDQALINTMFGKSILEFGKEYWNWGGGFSEASPTYPLNKDENYLGAELNLMRDSSILKVGTALDSNNDPYAAWLNYNSLLQSSDYTLIFSYSKDNSELGEKQRLNYEKKEHGINLGFDYSKDFLNGFMAYGEYNRRYWASTRENSNFYLLGGEYSTEKGIMIIMEYSREKNPYLTLVLGNQADIYSHWHWQLAEVINLDDYGEIRSLNLSNTGKKDLTPSIEIEQFTGPTDSVVESWPQDWSINFKLSMDIL